MARLYHFFILRNTGVTREAVEAVLNEAEDWFRYYETCYVVETTQSPQQWHKKLHSLVNQQGRLFICKFDEKHYFGWMAAEFWQWYQKKAPLAD
jgi:hypothetical protein